jgi:hypothetical protein
MHAVRNIFLIKESQLSVLIASPKHPHSDISSNFADTKVNIVKNTVIINAIKDVYFILNDIKMAMPMTNSNTGNISARGADIKSSPFRCKDVRYSCITS